MAQIQGIELRAGTKHPYVATAQGIRPCPIAESTDTKRMLTPWIAQVSGYDRGEIYSALRAGAWYK